jgi:hypothetical protein
MDSRLLSLPDGSVMFCRQNDSSFYAYQSPATPRDSFRPVIQTCPTTLLLGSTIQISGLQFIGLSQAVAYGDDSQTATNYPLVRILNKRSNHVRYCRTFQHARVDTNGNTIPSMGVVTGADHYQCRNSGKHRTGGFATFCGGQRYPSKPFDVTITRG